MCDTCGCNITSGNEHLIKPGGKLSKTNDGQQSITVLKSLLNENDHQAEHNREHFNKHQVLAINLMSSPGSGKTALLEATIDTLKDKYHIAVIWKPKTMPCVYAPKVSPRFRSPPAVPVISMRIWCTMPCTSLICHNSILYLLKTSATWSALPVLIWDSIIILFYYQRPKAMINRPNIQ